MAGWLIAQTPEAVAQETPGLSFYGLPGHITMPSALALPDGVFALSVNAQGEKIRRGNLVFQITPRLTGVFRYSYLQGFDIHNGGISLYDRSFDLVYHIADEDPSGWRPALAVGLQDFGGTGVYGAEYLVASRHFGPDLLISGGIGWGRFGSQGSFRNPLSALSDRFDDRPGFGGLHDTGKIAFDRFFRGDAALFMGLDWRATDRLRLSVEYSSDAMKDESRIIGFRHESPVNMGFGYRLNNGAELGLAFLHGSTLAVGLSKVIDPRRPAAPSGYEPGPPPIRPGGSLPLDRTLARSLADQGLILEGLQTEGAVATVTVSNPSWPATAQGWGRAARVLTGALPPEITTFRLRSQLRGMPMQEITLTRADLSTLEYAPDGAWEIWSRAATADVMSLPDPSPPPHEISGSWQLIPYIEPSFFDPDNPLRFDIGAEISGEWSPLRGLYFSGSLRQKVIGNLDQTTRRSNSVLPHVRSDMGLYFRDEGPRIPWATAEYFTRPGPDLYARMTLGLLETMYGGASAELLWAPLDRRLALGIEVNRVTQRDHDGMGFLDYSVTTGHASAYLDLGGGYHAQLDLGRYLAGDWGGTATMTRRFGNGMEVGAFFTLTDAGFEDFGEGSFDKGITLSLPIALVTGQPTRARSGITLRPILRDGGAKLALRNRLFELTRDEREAAEGDRWARFWR